jgi:hypothetical protein
MYVVRYEAIDDVREAEQEFEQAEEACFFAWAITCDGGVAEVTGPDQELIDF